MRRLTIVAVLGLSLLLLAATPAAAQTHTVRGAGTIGAESPIRFAFEATGTIRRASGGIRYEDPLNQLALTADVRCLDVKADGKARLAGKLRRPLTSGDITFTHIQFAIVDGGPPQQPSSDFIGVILADEPLRCLAPEDELVFQLTTGNIRVR